MVTPEQPTDQTTPARPTPEEIAEARTCLGAAFKTQMYRNGLLTSLADVETLIAATAPPTDEEIVDFALSYYETNDLGATTIRTRAKLLEFMHDAPSYRVSAMAAAVRHFLGPVKP